MADTVYDLITESFMDLGVLADGEAPSASQAQGALRKLNNMLDAWNMESLMVYGSQSYVFPLVTSQGTYTIGTGGDFNMPRPNKITGVYLRDVALPPQTQLDLPVTLLTEMEYQNVAFKAQQSTLPYYAYVDNSYPLSTISINPVPSTSQFSLVIWVDGLFSGLTLYQNFLLPPGYKRAITANLAIELAPQYEQEPSAITYQIATSGKDAIRANNLQSNTLSLDPRLTSSWFDIRQGRYVP